jgi:hypothetical protein
MIDLIRHSQVPSNLMHAAARGALSVPPGEVIEILVHLALHNPVFGEQARLTLAGWDEQASRAAASDPRTSSEVLEYWIAPQNLRPALLPALIQNSSVKEEKLVELAVAGSRESVEMFLASSRVMSSPSLLNALRSNPNLRANELADIENRLAPLGVPRAHAEVPSLGQSEGDDEAALAQAIEHYLAENAAELESEAEKPFQPIGMIYEDAEEILRLAAQASEAGTEPGATQSPAQKAAASAIAKLKKKDEKRDSTLQKIAKLDIKGRIALAMRGSKEDRSILIRDGTKLVALAVLDSPKVSDTEVESFALQKNVLESVLRAIPLKRRFAKNYSIMRNLVYNPRTPLDLSLGLMKNLLIHDLKNLSGNKEVSETIRKLALRMYKQKSEKKRQ